jgi:hypothetical protein
VPGDAPEIERAITTFARSSNGGLLVTASALAVRHRDLIVTLAARHKLPAVYWDRFFVTGGGLISYGPDVVDQFRRAASYVDRPRPKLPHGTIERGARIELAEAETSMVAGISEDRCKVGRLFALQDAAGGSEGVDLIAEPRDVAPPVRSPSRADRHSRNARRS